MTKIKRHVYQYVLEKYKQPKGNKQNAKHYNSKCRVYRKLKPDTNL